MWFDGYLKAPFEVHDFCQAMAANSLNCGGQSHGDWYSCVYHCGFLLGYHKLKWFVLAASDPDLPRPSPSCNDSCCYGSAMPELSGGGYWIRLCDLPEEAIAYARRKLDEAVSIIGSFLTEYRAAEARAEAERTAEIANVLTKTRQRWIDASRKDHT